MMDMVNKQGESAADGPFEIYFLKTSFLFSSFFTKKFVFPIEIHKKIRYNKQENVRSMSRVHRRVRSGPKGSCAGAQIF